jgi:hypothetical protein
MKACGLKDHVAYSLQVAGQHHSQGLIIFHYQNERLLFGHGGTLSQFPFRLFASTAMVSLTSSLSVYRRAGKD